MKLESVKARHPQLLYESKLYKILQVGYVSGTAVQQCCGSGMFIPDPDFYQSWIPDPTTKLKEKREIFFVLPIFVATNIIKL